MASSGMTLTGRTAVALVGTDEGVELGDDDGPTRVGVICWQGTLSDASLGSGTASSITNHGTGTTSNDETPTTGTEERAGTGGARVENWHWG